ncbi:MAG: UDP-N-acetylmuramoyl-tripeptide--D-alanyl-D-alanine ligase [Bacillota bacterium]
MNLKIEEICRAVNGILLTGPGDRLITGVTTDTRKLAGGEIFFALQGQVDGHEYVTEALQRGAAAAIVKNAPAGLVASGQQALIQVDDPLQALQRLANHYRNLFSIPVIGITGSNGKTTTKDMVAAALGARGPVLKTAGNFNNEIGVPLTLLSLEPGHQAAVVEMAMRGLGEISELCRIASPTAGVLTNISATHLETLGSLDNVARGKGELLEHIPSSGFALLNGDDPRCRQMADRCPGNVLFYGIQPPVDVLAIDVRQVSTTGMEFRVRVGELEQQISIPVLGEHNVRNALAALGVGHCLGLSLVEMREGLARVQFSTMRLEMRQGTNGSLVINDAYNANPASVKASLEVLSRTGGKRTIAVLGDMLELGIMAEKGHREVGQAAVRHRIDRLIAVGELARLIAQGALEAGMDAKAVSFFESNSEATAYLQEEVTTGDVILVKGSRGMHMEEIVACLEAVG